MGPAGKELGHVPAPRAPSRSGPYNREQLVLVCSMAAGTVGIVASQAVSPPPWREQIDLKTNCAHRYWGSFEVH